MGTTHVIGSVLLRPAWGCFLIPMCIPVYLFFFTVSFLLPPLSTLVMLSRRPSCLVPTVSRFPALSRYSVCSQRDAGGTAGSMLAEGQEELGPVACPWGDLSAPADHCRANAVPCQGSISFQIKQTGEEADESVPVVSKCLAWGMRRSILQ